MTVVGKKTFYSPINMEGSWGQRPVAKRAKSVMTLSLNSDCTGDIEWEIPGLDMYENIGLTFDFGVDGKRKLVDYDGVMSIPKQALDLLEEHGVDCSEMRE